MPLMPAMRPWNSMSKTAERPITTPPSVDEMGVNSVGIGIRVNSIERAAPLSSVFCRVLSMHGWVLTIAGLLI
jgi:hypothetical protein